MPMLGKCMASHHGWGFTKEKDMVFQIGTRQYVVRRKWALSCDGIPSDGLCDFTTRALWVDGDLPEEVIADVLRHEHIHAWEKEVGTPRTDEDRANFFSTVGDAFESQFVLQGALEALLNIRIEGPRPGRQEDGLTRFSRATDRIECGRCHAQVMVGSIATTAPRDSKAGFNVVERGCQCPVCDAIQTWEEKCTEGGVPLGEFYNVKILVGKEASEWIETHSQVFSPYNEN